MDFRKLLLIVLTALFAWQVAAMTIEELQELFYQTEDDAEFDREAGVFIQENNDLDKLEDAFWLWQSFESETCTDWLQTKALESPDQPKYRYLLLNLEDEPLAKLEKARSLIAAYPDFAGGYRALLLTYILDTYADELNDPDSSIHALQISDLPLIAHFGANFPLDSYARMAQVYYLVQSGDLAAAKLPFRVAVEAGDTWIDDVGLRYIFTPDIYQSLLAYQIEVLRENDDDPYTKYRIANLAGDLAAYYYEQVQDDEAVIDYFGSDPWYWENQYVIYALSMSYLGQNRPEEAVNLLTWNGDLNGALNLQNAWTNFDSEHAAAAYARVLGPVSDDSMHAYLLARASNDTDEKLAAARALVDSYPKVEHGYSLTTEVYLDYFSNKEGEDPSRAQMTAAVKRDAQIIRNYYFRFPENNLATVGYFLVTVMENDDTKAFRVYQELYAAGLGEFISHDIIRFTLNNGQSDLLLRIKEFELRQDEENSGLSDEEFRKQASRVFCMALVELDLYEELIAETARHAEWMDDIDIQFMVVNAHYLSNDIDQTMATLRMMVEKGTIGTTMLNTMQDPDLTTRPDWQPLLDYAATKPDPDYGSLYDEQMPEEDWE